MFKKVLQADGIDMRLIDLYKIQNLPTTTNVERLPNLCTILSKHASFPERLENMCIIFIIYP